MFRLCHHSHPTGALQLHLEKCDFADNHVIPTTCMRPRCGQLRALQQKLSCQRQPAETKKIRGMRFANEISANLSTLHAEILARSFSNTGLHWRSPWCRNWATPKCDTEPPHPAHMRKKLRNHFSSRTFRCGCWFPCATYVKSSVVRACSRFHVLICEGDSTFENHN